MLQVFLKSYFLPIVIILVAMQSQCQILWSALLVESYKIKIFALLDNQGEKQLFH